jgi:predicted nucleic-acid-binding protein
VTAFDTNVLVRVLLGDDPGQTAVAEAAFVAHAAGDGVYVPQLVLAELGWVLGTGYRLARHQIHERLMSLVRTRGVFVEDIETVLAALELYRAGAADLADYLILLGASVAGATPLLSFDRRLARSAGVQLLGAAGT